MSTPHIAAQKGEIASRVILAGDPLRVKYIADNYLENVRCYTSIRNMLGFTGTYKGKEVSVQGVGMGIPSMGIYAHELICEYGCTRLIRTGTCGSLSKNFQIKDVILAKAAATDSGTVRTRFGLDMTIPATPDFKLLKEAYDNAVKLGLEPKVETVFSSDLFYDNDARNSILKQYGVNLVEMECAELFTLGMRYNVQTLGILTVSDMMEEKVYASAEDRVQAYTNMMTLALETI